MDEEDAAGFEVGGVDEPEAHALEEAEEVVGALEASVGPAAGAVDLAARFLGLIGGAQTCPVPSELLLQESVAARRGCAQAALPGERHVGPVQRQRRLDEPELLQLVASYLGGESVAELARQFELHESTVHEHLNRLEIPKHP